jgi:hypothetical protein
MVSRANKEVRRAGNTIAAEVNHRSSVEMPADFGDQIKTSSSVGQRLHATRRSPGFRFASSGLLD